MTDTGNVTELKLRPLGPSRNALRQRRYRAKKRKSGTVTPVTPAAVTPAATPAARRAAIDVAAYFAAVALAGAAAWFSIRGMVVLFPGNPISVIAMASAMEVSKLVAAGWLAQHWRVTNTVTRFALMAFVLGLAVINAAGVFSQLVAAHVGERGAATSAVETRTATVDAKIEVAIQALADVDRRLNQVDTAIEEANQARPHQNCARRHRQPEESP